MHHHAWAHLVDSNISQGFIKTIFKYNIFMLLGYFIQCILIIFTYPTPFLSPDSIPPQKFFSLPSEKLLVRCCVKIYINENYTYIVF